MWQAAAVAMLAQEQWSYLRQDMPVGQKAMRCALRLVLAGSRGCAAPCVLVLEAALEVAGG
jgi:hypothetical protein